MWPLLRTIVPVDRLRLQAGAATTRLMAFAIAALLGLLALLYLLDAVHLALLRVMPGWQASLAVGGGLILIAGLVALAGVMAARKRERRVRYLVPAPPPPETQLAAIATPVVMSVLRHPRQIVLFSLLAGAALELFSRRR